MNILLDLLGALVIASFLLLTMTTFQFQLNDTVNRTLFTAQMIEHEEVACQSINRLIAMAGIGFVPDSTFVNATATSMTFRTYWDYNTNTLGANPVSILLSLGQSYGQYGRVLRIVQNGRPIRDLENILWLEDLQFVYYNKTDQITTDKRYIRSVDVMMTFRRDPPKVASIPLRVKVQIKCYLMNCYMRGA